MNELGTSRDVKRTEQATGEYVTSQPESINQDTEFRHRDKGRERGFTVIENAVLLEARIAPMTRLCYAVIVSYAYGNKRDAFPGQKSLAAQLGVKERSVRYYLTELEILGLISIEQRGLGKTNIYWIEPLDNLESKILVYLEWQKRRASERDRQPVATQDRKHNAAPIGNQLPTKNTSLNQTSIEQHSRVADALAADFEDSLKDDPKYQKAKTIAATARLSQPIGGLQQSFKEALADEPDHAPAPKCARCDGDGELNSYGLCWSCVQALKENEPPPAPNHVTDKHEMVEAAAAPMPGNWYLCFGDNTHAHLVADGQTLCHSKSKPYAEPTLSIPSYMTTCPKCVKKANTAPKPKAPRKPDAVFDAIALGSFGLTSVKGQVGSRIGSIAAAVKDCTPDEHKATLADDLPKMYLFWKAKGLSAPRDALKLCAAMAEWRTVEVKPADASANGWHFTEIDGKMQWVQGGAV